mmetsp:Transcript_24485/g.97154  ORF Transcript_24485/g.97154 Transcript_24485/m.97154 type:complete len:317 (+) Transcript_24485:1212-2162(+)
MARHRLPRRAHLRDVPQVGPRICESPSRGLRRTRRRAAPDGQARRVREQGPRRHDPVGARESRAASRVRRRRDVAVRDDEDRAILQMVSQRRRDGRDDPPGARHVVPLAARPAVDREQRRAGLDDRHRERNRASDARVISSRSIVIIRCSSSITRSGVHADLDRDGRHDAIGPASGAAPDPAAEGSDESAQMVRVVEKIRAVLTGPRAPLGTSAVQLDSADRRVRRAQIRRGFFDRGGIAAAELRDARSVPLVEGALLAPIRRRFRDAAGVEHGRPRHVDAPELARRKPKRELRGPHHRREASKEAGSSTTTSPQG